MKFRFLLFINLILIISCQNNNYEYLYNQYSLKESDCKDIKIIKWIFYNETGFKINNKIKIINTDYDGGIPLRLENFPIYYEVQINEKQYSKYKEELLNSIDSNDWNFNEKNEELRFVKDNKFELSCRINKEKILFGFRNVENIYP
jgi:hypothetical protein